MQTRRNIDIIINLYVVCRVPLISWSCLFHPTVSNRFALSNRSQWMDLNFQFPVSWISRLPSVEDGVDWCVSRLRVKWLKIGCVHSGVHYVLLKNGAFYIELMHAYSYFISRTTPGFANLFKIPRDWGIEFRIPTVFAEILFRGT